MPPWFPSAVGVAAALAAAAPRSADGPPPGRTGGFREPTCHECHHQYPLNAAGGTLALSGLPDAYVAGHTYLLTVVLTRPGMQAAGFQLAVRSYDAPAGRQAGELSPADDRTAIAAAAAPAPQYLQHTRRGTALTAGDTARWSFLWRAPDAPGAAVFHLAANAANDDNSELGDVVYTLERVVRPVR